MQAQYDNSDSVDTVAKLLSYITSDDVSLVWTGEHFSVYK